MAALNFSVALDGDVQLNRTLVGISDRATDWRPAWHAIADDLMDAEKRQFQSEGQFGSGGWQPLRPATKARRIALGYAAGPILTMTGDLKRSLTVKGDSGQVLVIAPHQFAFGTTVDYAGYHQHGTAPRARASSTAFGPQRPMPARRPLELPESVRKDIVKTAQRFWVTGSPR